MFRRGKGRRGAIGSGESRLGMGMSWSARYGAVRPGLVWLILQGHGLAGSGKARHGSGGAWWAKVWPVRSRCGRVGRGMAGSGKSRSDLVWFDCGWPGVR
jgi:hypothetical protein